MNHADGRLFPLPCPDHSKSIRPAQRIATITSADSSTSSLKVVSGGQTGVDRAALDAAMELGFEVGGWCPRDRRSEDGAVPTKYPLRETAARSYAVRTEWNVRDSDGTLILVLNEISSGTRLTVDAAKSHGKPLKIEHLAAPKSSGLLNVDESPSEKVESVVEWIQREEIRVLNIAGPRGSSSKDMYPKAKEFVIAVLQSLLPAIAIAKTPVTKRRRKK
jgi:hypothetical protein